MLRRASVLPPSSGHAPPKELDPYQTADIVRVLTRTDIAIPTEAFVRVACAKAVLKVNTLSLRTVTDHLMLLGKNRIRTEKTAASVLLRRASKIMAEAGVEDIRALLWSCRRVDVCPDVFVERAVAQLEALQNDIRLEHLACITQSLNQLTGSTYHGVVHSLVVANLRKGREMKFLNRANGVVTSRQYAALISAVLNNDVDGEVSLKLLDRLAEAPDVNFHAVVVVMRALGRAPLVAQRFLELLVSLLVKHVAQGHPTVPDIDSVCQMLHQLPTVLSLPETRLFLSMTLQRAPCLLQTVSLRGAVSLLSSLSRLHASIDQNSPDIYTALMDECARRDGWDATTVAEFLNVALHQSGHSAVQKVISMIGTGISVQGFTPLQLYLTMKAFGRLQFVVAPERVRVVVSECATKCDGFSVHQLCGVLLSCGNLKVTSTRDVETLIRHLHSKHFEDMSTANIASAIHVFHRCSVAHEEFLRKLLDKASAVEIEDSNAFSYDQCSSILRAMRYGKYCPDVASAARLALRVINAPADLQRPSHVPSVLELVHSFPSVAALLSSSDVVAIFHRARSVEKVHPVSALALAGLTSSKGVTDMEMIQKLRSLEGTFVERLDDKGKEKWRAFVLTHGAAP